jgi:16S rRNA (adenine(1408)-N(1))-methyltransferase
MTIARVIGKGRTAPLEAETFAALRAAHTSVAVDVGTGDGRFPYQLASDDPHRLVIGIDALAEPMGERAATAARKPARGGRPNLVYVHAAVEALPEELAHVADEVFVQLPWGALLEGIVRARPAVLGGIAALCRPGARIAVTLNGEIWVESTPVRYADLPVPTPEYVADVVAPGFAAVGLALGPARYATATETKELATTWARRLGHAREHPRFVQFEGVAAA